MMFNSEVFSKTSYMILIPRNFGGR